MCNLSTPLLVKAFPVFWHEEFKFSWDQGPVRREGKLLSGVGGLAEGEEAVGARQAGEALPQQALQ